MWVLELINLKNMNKNVLVALISVIVIFGVIVLAGVVNDNGSAELTSPEEEEEVVEEIGEMESFVNCLDDKNVTIYGSSWCPYCTDLVEDFGGYDIVDPIYVECTEEGEICGEEQKTTYVPEIQIKGEVYEGPRSFEGFTEKTGCSFKN